MLRYVALLVSILALSPIALAAQAAPAIVERDGYRFSYRSELTPDGLVRFYGEDLDTGRRFHLVLDKDGDVTGEVGGTPVRFSVARAKRDRVAAHLSRAKPPALASADGASAAGK